MTGNQTFPRPFIPIIRFSRFGRQMVPAVFCLLFLSLRNLYFVLQVVDVYLAVRWSVVIGSGYPGVVLLRVISFRDRNFLGMSFRFFSVFSSVSVGASVVDVVICTLWFKSLRVCMSVLSSL